MLLTEQGRALVVVDFETTGLSPEQGDRAIEIGAVKLENGRVVDSFQALMNPGCRIDAFIESYTGISNAMLANAASCDVVMSEFNQFLGDSHLLAHNAAFDKKFLDAEFERCGLQYSGRFLCSLLLSRRILQGSPNFKLATLINYTGIEQQGSFHRALYDAEMTAQLFIVLLERMAKQYRLNGVAFDLLERLQKTPKASMNKAIVRWHSEINSIST